MSEETIAEQAADTNAFHAWRDAELDRLHFEARAGHDVIAVALGDGGHRRAEIGTRAAADEAIAAFCRLRAEVDALRKRAELGEAFYDVFMVLMRSAEVAGDLEKAMAWFRSHRITDFGGRTPIQMVSEGKTQAVLAYIESLSAGALG